MNTDKPDLIIHSPGRINLIGEHTDYNGGYVLPAAINYTIKFSFRKNPSSVCQIESVDFDEFFEFELNNLSSSDEEWRNYILGVVYQIQHLRPGKVKGFECTIESNLPMGAGISSSAALECGIAKGLDELFDLELSDKQIIKLSRDAEHDFVGTKCGIMDQFSVVKGKENNFILLNCENLSYEYVPASLSPYQLVLLNTNVSHNLSSSAYNTRREECNKALAAVQKDYPDYTFLAEVPLKVVKEYKGILPSEIYNRMLYVVQENRRVLETAQALELNQLPTVGELLYASHTGLKDLYEVSCPELDFLVDFSRQYNYVLGSRMMGGGFGGCTINLIHKDHIKEYIELVSKAYKKKFDIELTPIQISISNGISQTMQHAK